MSTPKAVRGRRQKVRALSVPLVLIGAIGATFFAFGSPKEHADLVVAQLSGEKAPVPPGDALIGAASASTTLPLEVTLKPRDPAGLAAEVKAISTPGSPQYRHFLAPGQFAELYGPTSATIAAVSSALQSEGLTVGAISGTGLSLPVTATAGQVESAFSTPMSAYRLPSGKTGYDNEVAPSVPASIAPQIEGILGLDTLSQPVPVDAIKAAPLVAPTSIPSTPTPATSQPTPTGSSCTTAIDDTESGYGARDADELAQAYSFDSLYSKGDFGANSTVALVELDDSGYSTSDISTFANCYGISLGTGQLSFKGVDGATNSTAGGVDESELDIDTVLSLAPAANIKVYLGTDSLYDVFNQIESDDTAKVVSASWTNGCEDYVGSAYQDSEKTLLDAAAMQGQSIFVAAGDQGSQGCNVNGEIGAATGSEPSAQVLDPSTNTIYVANHGGTSVSVIDEASYEPVGSVTTPVVPDAVALDTTDAKIFVADNGASSELTTFSTTNCNATTTTGCGSTTTVSDLSNDLDGPTALAVDGSTLYVGNETNHTVSVFNATSDTYEGVVTLPSGANPSAIVVAPNHTVYVSDLANGQVDYFDGTACNASSQSGCSSAPNTVAVGTSPVAMTIDATVGNLYVANEGGGISVISTSSHSLVTTIATNAPTTFDGNGRVESIGMSPDGHEVLAVVAGLTFPGDVIATINPSTNEVSASVNLESGTHTMGALVSDPTLDLVWVTDEPGNEDVVENLNLNVSDPASQPDVTGVGGTSLTALGPAPIESVWNDDLYFSEGAGGGGISETFPMPSYQQSLGVLTGESSGAPCANLSGDCREVPDVSGDGDPSTGYVVYISGQWFAEGGTSAAAPLWAAVLAVVSSADDQTNGYGDLNPTLYGLAAAHPGTYFNDVTTGSNDYNATSDGSYPALTGYDMATGLGTPITSAIASGFASSPDGSGTMSVSPTSANSSSTGNTLVFTYTAATGGTSNGEIQVTVPSGWPAPSATAGASGSVSSTCGGLAVVGSRIETTSVTLSPGATCTITYGDRALGGSGATAPEPSGSSTFSTSEKSTATGTLTALGASPEVTINATIPTAPTGASANAGVAQATVSWTAPALDGGSTITSYTVTAADATTPGNGGQICTWSSGPLTCTVTGLTNGDSYSFSIIATNSVGSSASSPPSNSIVPTTVPSTPSAPSAAAGNGAASVTWTAPSSSGSIIVSYTVTAADATTPGNGGQICTWSSGPLTCNVTGLTNADTYSFSVVATNGVGSSAPSPASNAVVPEADVPGAPANVSATAGDTSATVSWTDPSNGGSPIIDYTVNATDTTTAGNGGQTCVATGANATSCSVDGLTDGDTYDFNVTARNATGSSIPSSSSNSVTPNVPPPTTTTTTTTTTAPAVATTSPVTSTTIAPTTIATAPTTTTTTSPPAPQKTTVLKVKLAATSSRAAVNAIVTYTFELFAKKNLSTPTGKVIMTTSELREVRVKVKGKFVMKNEEKTTTLATGTLHKGVVKLIVRASIVGIGAHVLKITYEGNNKYKAVIVTKNLTVTKPKK